jgi:hypothetical protein
MTVFELIGTSAWIDWASRGQPSRLGLFATREKAKAKIKEIKQDKNWKMDWETFHILEVEVR